MLDQGLRGSAAPASSRPLISQASPSSGEEDNISERETLPTIILSGTEFPKDPICSHLGTGFPWAEVTYLNYETKETQYT